MIANSLSITIAQRTREFATLRTLGASRRQVLPSIVIEALVIGMLASVVGVLVGLRAREGALQRSSTPSASRCRTTASSSRRARSSSRCSSGSSSRCSRACARRCARRACRRSRRCARAPTLPEGRFARYRTLASALLDDRSASPRSPTGSSAAGSSTTQILLWHGARHAADLLRRRAALRPHRAAARLVLGWPAARVRRRRRARSPATTRSGTRSAPRRPRRR